MRGSIFVAAALVGALMGGCSGSPRQAPGTGAADAVKAPAASPEQAGPVQSGPQPAGPATDTPPSAQPVGQQQRADTHPAPAETNPAPAPAPESGPDGISREEMEQAPPLAPTRVRVERLDGRATLVWCGAGNESGRYEIYRRTAGGPWQMVANVPAAGADTGEYRWDDPNPPEGAEYGVAAVSPYGMKSSIGLP